MKIVYSVQIYSVDDITAWSMQGDNPSALYDFLTRYNHKGDSIDLFIDDLDNLNPTRPTKNFVHGEEVYKYLGELITTQKTNHEQGEKE